MSSGLYTADSLLSAAEDARVDIIDKLPAPFGLIRYGVAPDHQTTKNIQRKFGQTAQHPAVRFFGNVEIGTDVTIEQLTGIYDAVVMAVGAPRDRRLGIPGDDLPGVIGSASLVGWYNAHPEFRHLEPDLNTTTVAVIGNGNVAIDIARVLVKTPDEMASSDIADYALSAIQASPITDVHLIGRRGPADAKFTNVELREMGNLDNCAPVIDAAILPETVEDPSLSDRDRRLRERNLGTLREFAEHNSAGAAKRVHFDFFLNPVEVLGDGKVEALRLERTAVVDGRAVGTGETLDMPCGLVLPAIGYRASPIPGIPFDEEGGVFVNDDGRMSKGLYVVGWAKRGPTGVIGSNKPDGRQAAEQIVADMGAGGKPGRDALTELLTQNGVRLVSYDEWQRVDAAEVAAADDSAPRRKFATVEEMLSVLELPADG
jgi:NADPH-dependent glutamate synthase beta subunit-like oxidoreductase